MCKVLSFIPSTIETGCGGTPAFPGRQEQEDQRFKVMLHYRGALRSPVLEWTWPINK